MNEYIKRKIMDKKVACKSFDTNSNNYDAYLKPQTISTELSEMILKRKDDYHRQLSGKLNDPKTSAEAYWSILKTLYNGKKIPLITEWNKLDLDVRKSRSYATFRNTLLKLGRPIQCTIYSINNPVGLKLLTRLRLGLSHLNEHRFNHNLKNCINPLCSCSLEIESISHFLLHCHHYTNIRLTLLKSLAEIIGNTFNINDECLVNLLLFGNQKYTEIDNLHIINATIKYLLDSGRFSGPLL